MSDLCKRQWGYISLHILYVHDSKISKNTSLWSHLSFTWTFVENPKITSRCITRVIISRAGWGCKGNPSKLLRSICIKVDSWFPQKKHGKCNERGGKSSHLKENYPKSNAGVLKIGASGKITFPPSGLPQYSKFCWWFKNWIISPGENQKYISNHHLVPRGSST